MYKQIHNELSDWFFYLLFYVMKNEKVRNSGNILSKCIKILSGYFEKKIAIIPQYEMFGGYPSLTD